MTGFLCIRVCIVSVLAVAGLMLSGCAPFETTETPSERQLASQELDEQRQLAVSLYVDAMMLNDLDDYAEALLKLEQATEADSEFALAFSLKGDLYQQLEQYEQSADAYERATTLDPWSFSDFLNLGTVSRILEQYTRAARAFVAASRLDPEHYEAHIGAARSFFDLDDLEQAREFAQKARDINPDQPDAERVLGDIFDQQREPLEAINAYRRVLELKGNEPDIMIRLARSYLRADRFSSAKELLQDVLEQEPDNALAFQYLGFAQLRLKQTEEAIESYQLAVRLGNDDWMAHKSLGVAYMIRAIQQDNDERIKALAVEQWTISLQINPDQPQLNELMARYN